MICHVEEGTTGSPEARKCRGDGESVLPSLEAVTARR